MKNIRKAIQEQYEVMAKADMRQLDQNHVNAVLDRLFPKASATFRQLNSGTSLPEEDKNAVAGQARGKKRGCMNKTEAEFALILEAMKRKGQILRYEFEGITLRFNGVRYTPDFIVFHRAYIKLIEIKGGYTKGKFERAVERFRHAKTYWTEFEFELHQKTKEGWQKII